MFGGSGVVAVYGVGGLLACAGGVALPGRRRMHSAAPPVPEQAVAGVKADIGEINERAHQ